MDLSSFTRSISCTLRWGSMLTLLAFISVGCNDEPTVATNDVSDDTEIPYDPPPEPAAVKMPDGEAELVMSEVKWYTDFEKAKAAAAKSNKDIFMEFTGSDWCPPCKRFHDSILQWKNFTDYAQQRYVLLKLDYPRGDTGQSSEEKSQNEMLAAKYGIESYPTVLLADSQARVYGQVEYEMMVLPIPGFAAALEGLIQVRHTRDVGFADASQLKGAEKVKKIEETILEVGQQFMLPSYEKELARIVKLDKDDSAGFRKKYGTILEEFQFQNAFFELQKGIEIEEYDDTIAKIDAMEKKYVDYKRGLFQIGMLKVAVYQHHEKIDELISYSEPFLSDSKAAEEDVIGLRATRAQALMKAELFDEAVKEIDVIVKDFPDRNDVQLSMLLMLATVEMKKGNRPAAKKFTEKAKLRAIDPRRRSQIAIYAAEILGPEEDPPEIKQDPADKKIENEKPTPPDAKTAPEKTDPETEKVETEAKELDEKK